MLRAIFHPSSLRFLNGAKDDPLGAQGIFVRIGNGRSSGNDQRGQVEAAGNINGGIFVGAGAYFDIIGQDAVGRQSFIAGGSGAEDHQLTITT